MPSLREAESAAQIECHPDDGRAIKALAADPNHKRAWEFILAVLCGTDRLSFALPDESPAIMGWRQGRRFVGLTLRDMVATPIIEETPPEPPAKTLTERARRRNKSSPA